MNRADMNALADLLRAPAIDMPIARDLLKLEVRSLNDLVGRDPDSLFDAYCALKGKPMDRYYLYVFRAAVYFAETPAPEIEKLPWFAWKD